MRNFLRNNAWVAIVLVFMIVIAIGYRIVTPDEVNGKENPYDIPQSVIDSAERWGGEYGISPELLEAIAWHESRYIPTAVNKAGNCFGLMQIKQSAHSDRMARLGVTSLFDGDSNMRVAADYFAELAEEYEDVSFCLMTYHGESDAEWKYQNGFMSSYAEGILDMAYELETLHGKHNKARFTPGLDWSRAVG